MGIVELFLLAVGLSMDAFSVSVCKGLGMRRVDIGQALALAVAFGGFQGLMPLIGWAAGSQFMWLIEPIDHWIAFILLAAIGSNMIREALRDDGPEEAKQGRVGLAELLMLAVATSIDALTVGIAFASLRIDIVFSCALIALTTFVLSFAGVWVGSVFGSRFERPAQVAGGVILILIGTKVLLEHLGILVW